MTFCHLFKNYPMMVYQNLEPVSSLKKIRCLLIFLMSLILISIIGSIIYIHISNDKNNSNTRRKLDEIEEDITTLYNYTETMSDFIVDNYKPPEIKSGIQTEILFNNLLKVHLDLKKEFDDFKNKSHQVQLDLKKEFDDFRNKSHQVHLDLKKTGEINKIRTEAYFREKALKFLKDKGINSLSYFSVVAPSPCLNDYEFDVLLFEKDYYFEELLKIDYDNFTVSFAYFSDDTVENFKAHPIYKRINSSLIRDYNFIFPLHEPSNDYWWLKNRYYINHNYQSLSGGGSYGIVYNPNLDVPFRQYICIPSYEITRLNAGYNEDYQYISKVYDEYEYIRKLVSFLSFPPQKFI